MPDWTGTVDGELGEEGVEEVKERVLSKRPWLETQYSASGETFRMFVSGGFGTDTPSHSFNLSVYYDGGVKVNYEIGDEPFRKEKYEVGSVDEALEIAEEELSHLEAEILDNDHFRSQVVERIIERRGKSSMRSDASQTASVVVPEGGSKEEFLKWANNSASLDYEAVDTAAVGGVQRRIQGLIALAEKAGFVSEFKSVSQDVVGRNYDSRNSTVGARNPMGFFSSSRQAVFVTHREDKNRDSDGFPHADRYEQLVAHEFGHAVSHGEIAASGSGYFSTIADDIFHDFDMHEGKRESVKEEFHTVSGRVRGDIEEAHNQSYREQTEELFADWIAAAVLDPEWTFEQSPTIMETLHREVEENQHEEAFAVLEPVIKDELGEYATLQSDLVERYENPWTSVNGGI